MPAPTITKVSPSSGPVPGGNTVSISGSGFTNATAVAFGSTIATSFTVVSDSTINAVVPSGPSAGGTVSVLVAGPGGTSAAGTTYTYAANPVVGSVTPNNGPAAGGNTVSIGGANFTNTTAVAFGSTIATSFTVVSSSTINAVVPPGPSAGGTVSVLVTGPGGTSIAGTTYTYMAAPVVSGVSPNSGPAAGGNTVSISGSGFTNAMTVAFGSTVATAFNVVSNSTINAVVPPGPSAGGTVSVLVTGPGGTSVAGITYTYISTPPPSIMSLAPSSGPVSGANTVTIMGSNFNGATAVTFAGHAASSFTVLSSSEINTLAPPGTPGVAPVVVTTPAGTSAPFGYTYVAAPAPMAVFPTTDVTAGGKTVTITGTSLSGTTSVSFGAVAATSFTVVSDTEVDAVTPMHLAGTVPIIITTPGGTDSSLSFKFQQAPVISSITPTSGPNTGGTLVNISGAGLIDTLAVHFGLTPATSFAVISDNTVTAASPARAAGASAVTVDTASATSNGAVFLFVNPPTLTTLSPPTGAIIGGNNVTLTGTGFIMATAVTFGANPAVFHVLSDTLMSAVAPSGSGVVRVTVTNPGGTSGSQTYTYS